MEDGFSIKQQMIEEALIILRTIDFLEKQIKQKILEIDIADNEYKDNEAEALRLQLSKLLLKLNKEDIGMDAFLLKYKIKHEKEKLVSNIVKKKAFHLRSFPPNARRL